MIRWRRALGERVNSYHKIKKTEALEPKEMDGVITQFDFWEDSGPFYYSSTVLLIEAHATFGVDGCMAITPRILPDAAKQLVLKFHEDLLK
ncbi:LOW QUALITY PROTEIN: hypothetical protein HID58_079260 [Brassica napus]|uniref:Uncharacterized protein n=1 Tax=Brassica napus TaxID=3708 RepID=A0ABQ7Y2U7_BRANA|nr:LOW QUALITY PROTEIN: hypothetical protein HID58_079260 [Brassica napus]